MPVEEIGGFPINHGHCEGKGSGVQPSVLVHMPGRDTHVCACVTRMCISQGYRLLLNLMKFDLVIDFRESLVIQFWDVPLPE